MDLTDALISVAAGRAQGLPMDSLASRLGLNLIDFEKFERNLVMEFMTVYAIKKTVQRTADSLGWPLLATYYANSVYGFSKKTVNGQLPLHRQLYPDKDAQKDAYFIKMALEGASLGELGSLIPGNSGRLPCVMRGKNKLIGLGLFEQWKEFYSRNRSPSHKNPREDHYARASRNVA